MIKLPLEGEMIVPHISLNYFFLLEKILMY